MKIRYAFVSLATLLLSVLCSPGPGQSFEGKVLSISEADLMTVAYDGGTMEVRLYGVDAPEKSQSFGEKARKFTSDQVQGKVVTVDPIARDRDGRTLAIISADKMVLNRELVGSGLAWVYEHYCTRAECREWKKLQEEARNRKTGLWSVAEPVAPWDFRNRGKVSHFSPVVPESPSERGGVELKKALAAD